MKKHVHPLFCQLRVIIAQKAQTVQYKNEFTRFFVQQFSHAVEKTRSFRGSRLTKITPGLFYYRADALSEGPPPRLRAAWLINSPAGHAVEKARSFRESRLTKITPGLFYYRADALSEGPPPRLRAAWLINSPAGHAVEKARSFRGSRLKKLLSLCESVQVLLPDLPPPSDRARKTVLLLRMSAQIRKLPRTAG